MAYLGNRPAEAYSAFQKQDFSTSATTSYTLDHPVANQNEIALFINFVRQEPTAAYTASGTTLTLTSATASSDDMYCVYLGKAVQTVNPPSGSVGNSQVASTIITGQTAETSIATDDTVLIHDTSAGALRKMTRANFVSGVGGVNTPVFQITLNAYQTISSGTATKVALDNARIDTASGFDATNDRWVVPSGQGGKYCVSFQLFGDSGANSECQVVEAVLRVNGTNTVSGINDFRNNNGRQVSVSSTAILDLSASDYLELWGSVIDASGSPEFGGGSSGGERYKSQINGFKIIE